MSKLIFARHGATTYNEEGRWTGITEINMSSRGYHEIDQAAEFVADYPIDLALSSVMQRAIKAARRILAKQSSERIPLLRTELLNEKDYGVYTGRNKEEVKAEVGEEEFMQIRRSWDYRIERGESLQDVHARVLPVHKNIVIPVLDASKNVLVSSHNNTLRAYVKEVEDIADDEACNIELGTAEVRIYDYSEGVFALEALHKIGEVH